MYTEKDGKILFYPVVLIPGRSGTGRKRPGPFKWLRPCDTAKEARELVNAAVTLEGASMGFVTRFPEKGEPTIMVNYIVPTSARTPIEKYLMLCDLLDAEHPLD